MAVFSEFFRLHHPVDGRSNRIVPANGVPVDDQLSLAGVMSGCLRHLPTCSRKTSAAPLHSRTVVGLVRYGRY
ncbi:uncharacterized protein LY89DRAFT_682057 [Mollisia scopiformis]|uniref:Uncharacterized protein n=1 Tax=Mollisia scopiformis TaxID=149040 RepID=A0A194XJM1_MOLSC|nr:uncharacterized protein LY89DRAFT_682057 [Mollisia scopiformis]KUJ20304.1 hypothetical protein LY89DRAFT_682057 [Mollisia scopiformis]